MSASEPVTYHIKYAGFEHSEVAQNYTLSLLASEGAQTLKITAIDGAKNYSQYTIVIYGIPNLKPELNLKEQVIPGEPFSVKVSWQAGSPQPTAIHIKIADQEEPLFVSEGSTVALSSVALGTAPQSLLVQVVLEDSYQRSVTLNRTVQVLADPRTMEDLNLSVNTLSVVTDEGQQREADTINAVYAATKERPYPLWNQVFQLPLEGVFTSAFGLPRRYISGGNISFHTGTDIAAPTGTPVFATNSGKVVIANFFPIKGGLVVIDHGAGVLSFYFHQSKLYVQEGDLVEKGQSIGEVGTTGLSTGPHLHWEMRVNGIPTDPMSWVGKILP
jgi:murein DD-endopeptidase MepM/ murein hydrolase activator NlpD